MSVLVIAFHTADALSPATKAAIGAARKLDTTADVRCISDESLTAEQIAPAIATIAGNYTHVITAADSSGKDVLPRVAALLDAPQISEIIEIVDARTFKRPIYAGNAIETVQVSAPLIFLTIRQSAFAGADAPASISELHVAAAGSKSNVTHMEKTASTRPELTSARVVISGGRGVGSEEGFRRLEELADKLGGAIGASRAAVDAGYAPNDYQIGQTGKNVAPDLYIAVGISGAIQHVAGMKDSKVIVAINKDENAPIFEIADYGLAGDLNVVLPELKALL